MSKRAKFAFITWIGENVGALKKAKVSTDKGNVKAVIQVGCSIGRTLELAFEDSANGPQ